MTHAHTCTHTHTHTHTHTNSPVVFTFQLAGSGEGYSSLWGWRSRAWPWRGSWDIEYEVIVGHTAAITTHCLTGQRASAALDAGLQETKTVCTYRPYFYVYIQFKYEHMHVHITQSLHYQQRHLFLVNQLLVFALPQMQHSTDSFFVTVHWLTIIIPMHCNYSQYVLQCDTCTGVCMPAALSDLEVVFRNGDATACASAGTCSEALPVVSPRLREKESVTSACPVGTDKQGLKKFNGNHEHTIKHL